MGLFKIFKHKVDEEKHLNGTNISGPENLQQVQEGVAVAKANVNENGLAGVSQSGINLLFHFLDKNYEAKGYDDALINADNTHLEQNIAALRNDLERTIRKVKTFYEDFIREINFHISSRSRSGMVDTVEELQVKKETAENHIRHVLEIEEETKNKKGVGEGIIISYTRGFKNGLAAISHHSIMNKNF